MSSYEEDAALFAERGEQWVREMLATNRLNDGRRNTARTWLDLQEAARRSSIEEEQIAIARSAAADASRAASAAERAAAATEAQAFAATVQAREARRANTRATIALVIAAISAIVTIVGIILR